MDPPPPSDATYAKMDAHHDALQGLVEDALAANARYTAAYSTAIMDEGYRLTFEQTNFRAYRRPNAISKHDDFLVVGTTSCRLDDVGYALHAETSQATRTINSFLYGHAYVGGDVIYTASSKTSDDPFSYFGIKRGLIQLLSPALYKTRETLYLDLMGTTADARGLPTIYTVRKSIELPHVPVARGCVRMDIEITTLYIGHPSNQVEYMIFLNANPHGNVPAFIYNQRGAQMQVVMDTLGQLAQIRRLIAAPPVDPVATTSSYVFIVVVVVLGDVILTTHPRSIQKCDSCPSVSKKWRFCRTCGQVTCKTCAFHISKPGHLLRSSPAKATASRTDDSGVVAAAQRDSTTVKEDYCKKCFHKARNPQAFKPRVLFGCDLSGEYTAVGSAKAERKRTPSSAAQTPTLPAKEYPRREPVVTTKTRSNTLSTSRKTRSESGDSMTSMSSSSTPQGPTRILHRDFSTPREHKRLERAGSDGNLLRNPTSSLGEFEKLKLRPLEEQNVEFNPELFESLEYQRKLLLDMQALMASFRSTQSGSGIHDADAA
ncbi:Aste57867_16000 [Aphanomyces stellatus]|uniref:Aste57867_16000 protein n=1 Tax=Aphanomyces stellatus TaxID=120398 RepID=A0A485L7L7_9STRA|nr:hypothetical protein As57867_015944 [Aphanomyces stellatus]VFT92785.1 Aste57867_16000 [Aphanomyces stellatus]